MGRTSDAKERLIQSTIELIHAPESNRLTASPVE